MNLYPFIEAEKTQQRTLKRACELLKVSRAAYYAHRVGSVSIRQLVDEELTERIRQAHQASKGRYGARGSTRSCAAKGTGTAASGSRDCWAPPACTDAPRAGSSARHPRPGRC